jgi:UDP-hydrolysing UDP-N-acetyl-D-glucosamine 2-epimerase
MKRKICVVITARPSYSRIKTALRAIDDHCGLELQLVVTSSALLEQYGATVNFIERDGFSIIAHVNNLVKGENGVSAAQTIGLGLRELSVIFENIKPDVVVTVADRYETVATATCASVMQIPLAHIQGGEVTGNIDEKIRHAVTKLSDLHFVSTNEAQKRVIQLGELPEKVFWTGCPSIDIAAKVMLNPALDFDPNERYGDGAGRSEGRYLVVMQHPVTTEYQESRQQIDATLDAVRTLNIPTFWFCPNPDNGSQGTSEGIRLFRENNSTAPIRYFKNMDPIDFLKLIKNAACLIGNSSVGIRECSYLGIPVVNIGTRQTGRERGRNVIDVNYKIAEIVDAVSRQLKNGHYESEQIYGHGGAGPMIASILATAHLTSTKIISY